MAFRAIKASYLDASAAVKLVVNEPGSDVIRGYIGAEAVLEMTDLCLAETLGVLKSKRHFRNELTQTQYEKACYLLLSFATGGRINIHNVTKRELFFAARDFMLKYELDLSDALQILTVKEGVHRFAVEESKSILITADAGLAKAARAEGLRTWNIMESTTPPEA